MSELENENVEQVTEQTKKVEVSGKSKFMNPEEYSENELIELEKLYENSFQDIVEGEITKGRIVSISDDHVVLDVGFKSDGSIPKNEFSPDDDLKVGNEVDIVIESVEDEEGNLVLSKKRADFLKIWDRIMNAYETEEVLQGKILKRIKGGMVVDILGLEAFLPGSQIDIRPVRDFDAFVGQTMDFRIVKVNVPTENVVVSHKVLIEETISDQRKEILEGLEKGQILEGIVKAITDFGVFIDLGGVDGLIHITDLSWGRINHPSEVVQLDENIKVVVTDFDTEKKRISLSLKQLLEHPWENIEKKYNIGDKVSGRVVSLTDYGAFIEIEKGIEGLIHISEMSWTQHINHPSQFVSMGQIVEAVILSLDKNEKKISLGMKQLTPDPWEELMKKYPVGSKHSGIARNLTNFGVFVELEPGIDGLVHISDLSWTKKIRHPGEVVKKGEQLDVVVLAIDTDQRKISLGHKQIEENPWDTFEREYPVGKIIESKVVRIIEKGLIAELPLGVDGFIPGTLLSTSKIKNFSYCFPVGSELSVMIIEFDKENKKIVLSALAALKDKSEEEIAEYIKVHKLEKVTVEDIQNADVGDFDPSDFKIFEEQIGHSKRAVKGTPKKETKVVEEKETKVAEEKAEEKTEVVKSEESESIETTKEPVETETTEEAKATEEKVEEKTEVVKSEESESIETTKEPVEIETTEEAKATEEKVEEKTEAIESEEEVESTEAIEETAEEPVEAKEETLEEVKVEETEEVTETEEKVEETKAEEESESKSDDEEEENTSEDEKDK
ncbi:MAG: 30S ribosomal protein S1 [Chlorobi bacterium]|nr:30S ribosomal protein S1 [Chlorobiota bacterium]